MAYNFFVDSDVILDFLMGREPYYQVSKDLFERKLSGEITICTTAAVILNVQYISQKIIGKEKSIQLIKKLVSLFSIIFTFKETILKPALVIIAKMFPMYPLATASGLSIVNVLLVAIFS